jgi:PAS domain S-box-containing protein
MSELHPSYSISDDDIAAVLSDPALAPLRGADTPFFIAAGAPLKIVHANPAAHALFRAGDLDGLDRRLLNGREPGARRLVDLARSLAPEAPPRLERLRFFFGSATEIITFICRQHGAKPLFVAGALNVRPALLAAGARFAEASAATDSIKQPIDAESVAAISTAAALPNADAPAPAAAGSYDDGAHTQASDTAVVETPAPAVARPTRPRETGAVRFLWQTDAERRFVKLNGALCETMGCETADLIGQDFVTVAERFGVDSIASLRAALTRQETWSGLKLLWPFQDSNEAAPVTLGGLPTFDSDRTFTGFSGFGVINLDRVVERPPAPPAETPAAEPAAVDIAKVDTAEADTAEVDTAKEDLAEAAAKADEPAADAEKSSAVPEQDNENDALDQVHEQSQVHEQLFAPQLTDPGYVNYAPNVVALREWQRDQRSAIAERQISNLNGSNGNGKSDAVETVPAEERAVEDAGPPRTMHEHAPAEKDSGSSAASVDSNIDSNAASKTPVESKTLDSKSLDAKPPVDSKTPPEGQGDSSKAGNKGDDGMVELSASERNAFREIARSLVADIEAKLPRHTAPVPSPVSPADNTTNNNVTPLHASSPDKDQTIASGKTTLETKTYAASEAEERGDTPSPASTTPHVTPAMPVLSDVAPEAAASEAELLSANATAILDRLNLGVLVTLGGVPAYVNHFLLDMIGFPNIDEFHDWGGPERMFRGYEPERMSNDGASIQLETHSGALISIKGRLQKIDWNGAPGTLMTFRTAEAPQTGPRVEELQSEARKQETEIRELHAILDTATDGVAILGPDGNILSLNRSAEALFGYERGEVVGQSFNMLFARESQRAAQDYIDGLKSDGVKSVLNDGREVIGRARLGGQIPMFMTIGRIGTESATKFCAVLRDMSHWKNAERELKDARRDAERASSLKSDFLAKISHEIRTPLNAILGFAEVIIDERFGPVGNERYKEYLRDIHASGTHVMSLVNDLLDLSKIEAGKLDLTFGSVDANKIVNECVSIMQPQSIRERVIMRLALAPHLPNIVADERSLRQIVLNILSNAVKFNQPGGQVIVSTALTDSGQAVVRVRDTGIGMSEQDVEIALEPFRQIQTSRQTTGTGLGLPLTKALVEANRASFSIKSKKGEGTLVEVTFPATRVLAE